MPTTSILALAKDRSSDSILAEMPVPYAFLLGCKVSTFAVAHRSIKEVETGTAVSVVDLHAIGWSQLEGASAKGADALMVMKPPKMGGNVASC